MLVQKQGERADWTRQRGHINKQKDRHPILSLPKKNILRPGKDLGKLCCVDKNIEVLARGHKTAAQVHERSKELEQATEKQIKL